MLTWKLEFFDDGDDRAPSRTTTIEAVTVKKAAEMAAFLMRGRERQVDATPVGRCRPNAVRLN